MKRVAMFVLVIVLALVGTVTPACDDVAHAASSTGSSAGLATPFPDAYTYYYYSDLAFSGGGTITLAVGKTKRLDLTTSDSAITWKSSDVKVASVTQTGVVRGKGAGIARVTARDARTGRSISCLVKVYEKRTQAQARRTILSLKKAYYPGRRWTNRNYYYWQAANCHCYGCIAFAAIASDKAFGKYAPIKRHTSFSKIRAGDHVRIADDHSMIALYKRKKAIVVAEGNYNSTFKWGRKVSYAELRRQGFYVETRY